jgi:hypothetical protein
MSSDLEVLITCKIGAVRCYSKRSTRLTKANLGAKLVRRKVSCRDKRCSMISGCHVAADRGAQELHHVESSRSQSNSRITNQTPYS